MKKEIEKWIGEQCSEIEENMKKNNSKRTYPTLERLDHCERRESYYLSGTRLTKERQILNR